jgi:hypothetical protein
MQRLAKAHSLQCPLQGAVKSRQQAGVVIGQGSEVEIGHLLAPDEPHPAPGVQIRKQRDIVRPEDVTPLANKSGQPVSQFVRSRLDRGIGRVRENPDKSVFRDGARGLGLTARLSEPSMRRVVIQVRCVEKGNEHVDVEQVRQRLFPQVVHDVDIYPCPRAPRKHQHAIALLSRGGGFRGLQYQLGDDFPKRHPPLA